MIAFPRLSDGNVLWIQSGVLVFMVTWFGSALLWTLGVPVLNVSIPGLDCNVLVLCRSGTIEGGHTFVWLSIWGLGLGVGLWLANPVFGFLHSLFWGALHETTWNFLASVIFSVEYARQLDVGVLSFAVLTLCIVGACLSSSKFRSSIDWKRLAVLSPFWFVFMGLWASIGFPVTLFGGHSIWFLSLQVNLIEISSFLIFFSIAAAVIRRPLLEVKRVW